MAKISEIIRHKARAIEDETDALGHAGPLSQEVSDKAQLAIFGGRKSPQWRTYMELFSGGEPANMDRLMPPESNPDPDTVRERARAYLVANGMCSDGTTTAIAHNVAEKLDQ